MEKLKKAATAAKEHLKRQKAAYAFAALALLLGYGNVRSSKMFNEFLKEEGINPLKFSCPEWYEEIKNEK